MFESITITANEDETMSVEIMEDGETTGGTIMSLEELPAMVGGGKKEENKEESNALNDLEAQLSGELTERKA